ncbi:MAG TPA: GNAT family N-acetyltransferase [Cellulomonas sp.]
MLRPAAAADAPALAALAAVTFPLACPPTSTAADQAAFVAAHLSVDSFTGYLADPARSVLVAGSGGALVGYTMLVRGEPYDPDVAAVVPLRPTAELSKCYVLPGQHGRGVAGALMTATLDLARAGGAVGVWLGVNGENLRAQAFYRRSGFTVVGERRFLVGGRLEHDLVLHRTLASGAPTP